MSISSIFRTISESIYFAISLIIGRIPLWFVFLLFSYLAIEPQGFLFTAIAIIMARAMLLMQAHNQNFIDFIFKVSTKYILKPIFTFLFMMIVYTSVFYVFESGTKTDYWLLLAAVAVTIALITIWLFYKKKPDPKAPFFLLDRGAIVIITVTLLWAFALYYIIQKNGYYASIAISTAYIIELLAHLRIQKLAGNNAA